MRRYRRRARTQVGAFHQLQHYAALKWREVRDVVVAWACAQGIGCPGGRISHAWGTRVGVDLGPDGTPSHRYRRGGSTRTASRRRRVELNTQQNTERRRPWRFSHTATSRPLLWAARCPRIGCAPVQQARDRAAPPRIAHGLGSRRFYDSPPPPPLVVSASATAGSRGFLWGATAGPNAPRRHHTRCPTTSSWSAPRSAGSVSPSFLMRSRGPQRRLAAYGTFASASARTCGAAHLCRAGLCRLSPSQSPPPQPPQLTTGPSEPCQRRRLAPF